VSGCGTPIVDVLHSSAPYEIPVACQLPKFPW